MMISYNEALHLTLSNIDALGRETVSLLSSVGRLAAEDIIARVDSPSLDVSLRDGYAIRSADIGESTPELPTRLRILGESPAGGRWVGHIHQGEAIRIFSGAPIPSGSDAVISQEFTNAVNGWVEIIADAYPGRNILRKGGDVSRGQLLASRGEPLVPPLIGELAAGGISRIPVYRRPSVAILATGSEVVAPGRKLESGKLYASNLVTLAAWCVKYGFHVQTHVVPDDAGLIRSALLELLGKVDVLLSSGGAWKGEYDFTVKMLDDLGWETTSSAAT